LLGIEANELGQEKGGKILFSHNYKNICQSIFGFSTDIKLNFQLLINLNFTMRGKS